MKTVGAAVFVVSAGVACGSLLQAPCRCETEKIRLETTESELQSCEANLLAMPVPVPAPVVVAQTKPIGRVRTRVVTKEGPPKQCGRAYPHIEPVKTVSCKKGYLCLDPENQRTLMKNEMEYRNWVLGVLACERSEKR